MSKLISILIYVLIFINTFNAQAAVINFQGTDIGAAVEFYEKLVVKLKKPVTVYNWSLAGAYGDSSDLGIAQNGSKTFWNRYGDKESWQYMFGFGLYAAVDPISTIGYGGYGSKNWLLTEMEFSEGFRLLDLLSVSASIQNMPSDVVAILSKFNCDSKARVERFFINGGLDISGLCQSFVKKVFKEILKIDGFSYSYGETYFKGCQPANRAFVITSSAWMKPESIRYYNSQSTHHLERRIQIQTLFYEMAPALDGYINQALQDLGDYMVKHPDRNLISSVNKCEGDSCVITAKFCDPRMFCEDVPLVSLPRPGGGVISAQSYAKLNMVVYTGATSLLWSDLEGKRKSTTTKEWLNKNKFGCNGKVPY